MRIVSAVLMLGLCLFSAACGEEAAAPTSTPEPSAPSPVASPAKTKATTRAASKPPAAKADPDAACDATLKAEDRLITVRGANGPLAVTRESTAAEVAAAVKALRTATQTNVRSVKTARALTTDTAVRAALADLIAARNAVITLLDATGTDVTKKNAALNTGAESVAVEVAGRRLRRLRRLTGPLESAGCGLRSPVTTRTRRHGPWQRRSPRTGTR
jgi:hypothetical protein